MSMVIKHDGSKGPAFGNQAVPFQLDNISRQAETAANALMADARREASRMIEEARREANTIRKEARERGLVDARDQAESQVDEKLRSHVGTLVPLLETTIQSLESARQEWLVYWQKHTVRLATSIAERILRREVDQQPDLDPSLVREALELATGQPRIRLHLHPDDHEQVHDRLAKVVPPIRELESVEFVPDPTIGRHECVVRTEFGEIDLTLQSQLARIEDELGPSVVATTPNHHSS